MAWMLRPRSTGLRNITSLLDASLQPSVQTGRILLARNNFAVQLTLQDVILARTAWTFMLTLPAGFRPDADMPDTCFRGNSDITTKEPGSLIIRRNGGVSIDAVEGMRHRRTLTFFTSNAMPPESNWPGVAA